MGSGTDTSCDSLNKVFLLEKFLAIWIVVLCDAFQATASSAHPPSQRVLTEEKVFSDK